MLDPTGLAHGTAHQVAAESRRSRRAAMAGPAIAIGVGTVHALLSANWLTLLGLLLVLALIRPALWAFRRVRTAGTRERGGFAVRTPGGFALLLVHRDRLIFRPGRGQPDSDVPLGEVREVVVDRAKGLRPAQAFVGLEGDVVITFWLYGDAHELALAFLAADLPVTTRP
ncbi:MAG: hypothetical protein HOV83_30525 [Catenulispora sp.]|nr:hypothetical protein [Catenulispora sp.]